MKDGIIKIDSRFARRIGFTSCKFMDVSYLWKKSNRIFISLIISREKRKGYLNDLLEKIENSGFLVAVPNPLGLMRQILIRKGFGYEFEGPDHCEVWSKVGKRGNNKCLMRKES